MSEYIEFERAAWLPQGFLWLDQAIATRTTALSEYWRVYRKSELYREEDARRFLELVTSTGVRLADPLQWTFYSNHGTQQIIGLLHLSISFPELPDFHRYAQLAIDRQSEQLDVIMDLEGVVLEHSAGYHRLGVELFGIALRYVTLLGQPIPPKWLDKYEGAKRFLWQMRRPDGTFPRVGDTSDVAKGLGPWMTDINEDGRAGELYRDAARRPRQQLMLRSTAGYAILWSGLETDESVESQTVVSWSNFPGRAHKHADELSVNMWTPEGNWWSSVGYWPFGHPDRDAALSWTGSNAQHLVNESAKSPRECRLRGSVANAFAAVIDAERLGPGAFSTRRQLVHVAPDVWLIVDWFHRSNEVGTRTAWGVDHDIEVHAGDDANSFVLTRPATDVRMTTQFVTDPSTTPRIVRGCKDPFAGWLEVDYTPRQTQAILIEQPAEANWAINASIICREDFNSSSECVVMSHGATPDRWRVNLPTPRGDLEIHRVDDRFEIRQSELGSPVELRLNKGRQTAARLGNLAAYAEGLQKYGRGYRDAISYRLRMTKVLALTLVAQELLLLLLPALVAAKKIRAPLSAAAVVFWVFAGIWLHGIRFPLHL